MSGRPKVQVRWSLLGWLVLFPLAFWSLLLVWLLFF